jgi:hypothetical protein
VKTYIDVKVVRLLMIIIIKIGHVFLDTQKEKKVKRLVSKIFLELFEKMKVFYSSVNRRFTVG